MRIQDLIQKAIDAREKAYAPYSGFWVGAALLAKNGKVYTGCNIENSAFSATNCAERTAFFKAISDGVRDFDSIAIVGGKKGKLTDFCAPCGVCRQVMAEFCSLKDFKLILAIDPDTCREYKLQELLPLAFSPAEDSLLLDPIKH